MVNIVCEDGSCDNDFGDGSNDADNYILQKGLTNIADHLGGTDIISCFMGQNPTIPVYRGEIQSRNLGMAVESWDKDGTLILQCSKFTPNFITNTQFNILLFAMIKTQSLNQPN